MSWLIASLFLLSALLVIAERLRSRRRQSRRLRDCLHSRHVFVVGGSRGLGLEVAKQAASHGACVTLLARDRICLQAAKHTVLAASHTETRVMLIAADVCTANLHEEMQRSVTALGPIHVLVCAAGFARAATFRAMSETLADSMLSVNYTGTARAVRAALPLLLSAEGATGCGGHVCLVSSLGGLLAVHGMAPYCASKHALVGLGHALSYELRASRVSVTIAYPPDMDTPGYAAEQVDKPLATRLVSEDGGLADPARVAVTLLRDTVCGRLSSVHGLQAWMVDLLASGTRPGSHSAVELLAQVLLFPLCRCVYLLLVCRWRRVIADCSRDEARAGKQN